MKKLVSALAVGLLTSAGAFAQVANVKSAEKLANSDKPDFAEARRLITEALANDETKNDPYTWYVAGLIENKAYTEGFKKAAIDQSADRTDMYKALTASVPSWLKVYELENQPNEKGKVNLKYTKKLQEVLHNDYLQLFNGGAWFLQSNKYAEAVDALEKYLEVKKAPFFAEDKDVATIDSSAMNAAYYAIGAASSLKEYDRVISLYNRFGSFALNPKDVHQWVSSAYFAKKDSVGAIPVLVQAVKASPEEPYFLVNLVNIYQKNGKEAEANKLLDDRIAANAQDATALLVKGSIVEEKDLKEALQWYYKAAKADAKNANAFIYLGAGLYNAAAKIYENTNVTQAMAKTAEDLLRASIPVLEIAYKSRPDNIKGMLGSIYYQLKMTDKRDALDAGTLNVDGATLPEISDLLQGLDLTVTKTAAPAVEAQSAQPAQKATAKKAPAKRRK
ncbi:tetratricopeptide repeat protein [Porphyromonas sp.]